MSIGGILILLIGLGCYFTPMIVALMRQHKNSAAIIVVNIFTGWTGIGWVVALAWACTSSDSVQRNAQ